MSADKDATEDINTPLRRVLIIAYGERRDANGYLASRLLEKLRARPVVDSWWLTLIEDAALRLEHALDLRPNDLAIFIDTSAHGKAPFEFRELVSKEDQAILPAADTVRPADLLHALATIGRQGSLPPSFSLALPLVSEPTPEEAVLASDAYINAAVDFLESLLKDTSAARWRSEAKN